MRVKKFTASSIPEALAQVKQEFGSDAIILHQKSHPKPFLGLFGKAYVEVTAGLDAPETSKPQANSRGDSYERAARETKDEVTLSSVPSGDIDRLKAMASTILEKRKRPPTPDEERLSASPKPRVKTHAASGLDASPPPRSQPPADDSLPPLVPETETLASLTNRAMPGTSDDSNTERLMRVEAQIANLVSTFATFMKRQEELGVNPNQTWLDELTSRGISHELAREIIDAMDEENPSKEAFREELAKRMPVKGPVKLPEETERPKVVLLVGPTGVGKTTTLAKLAASYAYDLETGGGPAQVVLVTADLYRLGAVEQIKEYAKILQIPLEQAYGPDEVADCIQRHKTADLVLVDTMGSSQRNEDQMGVLTTLTEQCRPCEIHLVVSATTKGEDLIDVMEKFSRIEPDGLIVTKTDEATTLGSVFNALQENPLPVSYVTTGQMVPEDIEIADSKMLAELILPAAGAHKNEIPDESPEAESEIERERDYPQTPEDERDEKPFEAGLSVDSIDGTEIRPNGKKWETMSHA